MKLFKVNVDYGQYVYAAESKQQLIDYLKENEDYNVCRYDSNIGKLVYLNNDEIAEMIVEIEIPDRGICCIGGYQE